MTPGGWGARIRPWANRPWAVLISLTAAASLAYANALRNPFMWDDQYLILDNPLIRDLARLPDVFTQHLYYGTAGLSNFYRPLQTLLLMAEHALWGSNVFGYHLVSLVVHVLCAWTAYLLIAEAFGRRGVAAMTAVLFAVHPINSTVVDYVSSRADSQAALGAMASFWMLLKAESASRGSARFWYLGSIAAFVAALLSKELGAVTPFWIAAGLLALRRGRLRRLWPFWAVLAVYAGLRLTVLSFPSSSPDPGVPLGLRLLTSAEALVRLIGLMAAPRAIHVEKGIPFSSGLSDPDTLVALAGLALAGAVAWQVRRRSRLGWFGIVWFAVCLLPMSNIVPLNTTLADHWLYLPGPGLLLAVIGTAADLIGRLPEGARRRAASAALVCWVIVFAGFGALTVRQNRIWSDPEQFFRLATRLSPQSFRAHNELGVLYLRREDYARAIEEFTEAVRLNPGFDQAYDNLGTAYDHAGELKKAVAVHRRALELNPNNPKTYNNLGNAYFKMGAWDQAIEAYSKALTLNPGYLAAYSNLGALYFQRGQPDQARRMWERALAVDPNFSPARQNLQLLRNDQSEAGR
ncbi:MAG TPA: tetratricopeptide repeat protein [bacterium]